MASCCNTNSKEKVVIIDITKFSEMHESRYKDYKAYRLKDSTVCYVKVQGMYERDDTIMIKSKVIQY